MMLKLTLLFGLVAVAFAAPQFGGLTFALGGQPGPQVAASPLVPAQSLVPAVPPANFVFGNNPDGSQVYGFQTLDGQSRQEAVGLDGSVRGSYSYVDANNQPITVHYMADQLGYRTSNQPFPASAPAPAPAPAPTPAPQPAFQSPQQAVPQFFWQQPQQPIQHHHQITTPAPPTPPTTTAAPAPVAAPVQTVNPFFPSLGHFGFQPVAAQPAAPVAVPIQYSFSHTGR